MNYQSVERCGESRRPVMEARRAERVPNRERGRNRERGLDISLKSLHSDK